MPQALPHPTLGPGSHILLYDVDRPLIESRLFPGITPALIEKFLTSALKVGDIHVALDRFRRQLRRIDR